MLKHLVACSLHWRGEYSCQTKQNFKKPESFKDLNENLPFPVLLWVSETIFWVKERKTKKLVRRYHF